MLVGASQGTITSLEHMSRGAYPKTLRRLCAALKVEPVDLLCAEPTEES
jgi:DNA-binding Xre family transcriptional regulator